jgi:type IV secretory pathway VirB3-like protein
MQPLDDAAPLAQAAARPRPWFGCDRRYLIIVAPLFGIVLVFAANLFMVLIGVGGLAIAYAVGRLMWAINPFLLDDFFGSWEFEERYGFDGYDGDA